MSLKRTVLDAFVLAKLAEFVFTGLNSWLLDSNNWWQLFTDRSLHYLTNEMHLLRLKIFYRSHVICSSVTEISDSEPWEVESGVFCFGWLANSACRSEFGHTLIIAFRIKVRLSSFVWACLHQQLPMAKWRPVVVTSLWFMWRQPIVMW